MTEGMNRLSSGAHTMRPMDLREQVKGWARATWWRSVLWSLACLASVTFAVDAGEARADRAAGRTPDAIAGDWWVLLWVLGLGLIILLWWRRRWPWQIAIGSSVLILATPLDPLVALVALLQVWIRSSWRLVAVSTTFVAAATFAATWRDTRGISSEGSFWWLWFSSEEGTVMGAFEWWAPVIITAVVMAAFIGIGWLRRELSQSRASGEGHRVVAAELSDEVARQAERERIAREVHDVIGHRLSLLSIHAGALEAQTRDRDDRLAGSASLVRESAAQTSADLRSLLEVLRRPDDPDLAEAVPGIDAIPALVDETVAHGMHLVATVMIDGASTLDPLLGQTAYRVVQELLTNARRHAPGAGVRLVVQARPDLGVTIEAANHRLDSGPLVKGNGLTGLHERVAQVGGEALVHVDEQGVLRTAVRLPWRFPAATEGTAP